MDFNFDSNKLSDICTAHRIGATADVLKRAGRVFFIGADLPAYSTLETMYESYCQESCDLFHITFGDTERFEANLDMVRQIKRNFSTRIMGRIGYQLSELQLQRVYLGGLDILDMLNTPPGISFSNESSYTVPSECTSAVAIFPRWSVVSSISMGQHTPEVVYKIITDLLSNGIIPLLDATCPSSHWNRDRISDCYRSLSTEWQRFKAPLKAIMPLLQLTTPFAFDQKPGYLRSVMNKIDDRRTLAASDLRRHLRTRGAEESFESAGL